MIDWLTFTAPLWHPEPIYGDRVMCISPDGEIGWEKQRAASLAGSYDHHIYIRTAEVYEGSGTVVAVHGNPAKWFQGHNLFGTDDAHGLAYETLHRVARLLHVVPRAADVELWRSGEGIRFSRVDVTQMFELSCLADVRAWLYAAEIQASMRNRGRGLMTHGTLYFGKHSRRWAVKFYAKGDEIQSRGHELPTRLRATELERWAQNKLRGELVLRAMELRDLELDKASAWKDDTAQDIYADKVGRLQMSEKVRLKASELENLPPRLAGAYQLWADGHDLRTIYPRATFYRYRNELRQYGIDVATSPGCSADRGQVVPLVRVLEAQAVEAPGWARGTELLFEPRLVG